MTRLRTLICLPLTAAAALLIAAPTASAVTGGAVAPSATTTAATARFQLTPSPILNTVLVGECLRTDVTSVVAMQRINWMWAPVALDGPQGDPLAKVFIPHTFQTNDVGLRDRHNLVADFYTGPGPAPTKPAECRFTGREAGATFTVTMTGAVVDIPKWLDALAPPILPPSVPAKQA